MNSIVKFEDVEKRIIDIRNQNVIIDSDFAELYSVETKRINEAVSNNPDKFPEGYIINLTNNEWNILKSKFSTSIKGGKTKLPKAFTAKGLYMLAPIIETFANIKNLSRNIKELSEAKDEPKKKDIMRKSGEIITEILGDDLNLNETETTFELNFAVLKLKHTIKRK